MTDASKGLSNAEKKNRNLSKLKSALESGSYVDSEGVKQPIPLKEDGTVSRGDLADGIGFARSAFQQVRKKGEKVDSDFAVLVNNYDLNRAGKSGAKGVGGAASNGKDEEAVKELKGKIDRQEKRIGTLLLELNEANKKLAMHGLLDDDEPEHDNGCLLFPW